HPVQNKESPKNSSKETVKEPPQDSDIHQLIEECSIKVPKQQKQKMEDTMLELNPQHLDKKEHEIKNVVEQLAEHRNRSIQSLQNFRVVHKSSISFKNTSQISSIHSIAPILSTKEPEHLLSMCKCEVTLEDKIECDMPAKDVCSPVFTTFSNPLFKDNDNFDSSNDESLPDEDVLAEEFKIYLNPLCDEDEINSNKLDPHCFNVEFDFVESFLNHDTFIDFSSKFDFSGDIRFLEELLIDDSILSHESFDSNFEENPSIPRPPPEPPDAETDAGEEIPVVMNDKDKFDDDS
nr:hypothetical protein [Tanacetum cinerariifolium]